MLKSGIGLGAVMAVGAYFSGAFQGGYVRVVERPPAQVMAALEDLDITAQPGAPGTDPSRSGGVRPLFRLAKGADAMTWFVMSGDAVATRMTARLEPLAGGAQTRVTVHVERGDAPDDRVSPAFRSVGITTGLFAMAVEGELNKLTAPAVTKTAAECQDMLMREMAAMGGMTNEGANLTQAMGNTAKMALRMTAVEDKLRQAGCPMEGMARGEFAPLSNVMGQADSAPAPRPDHPGSDAVTFQPGKPMVDLNRR